MRTNTVWTSSSTCSYSCLLAPTVEAVSGPSVDLTEPHYCRLSLVYLEQTFRATSGVGGVISATATNDNGECWAGRSIKTDIGFLSLSGVFLYLSCLRFCGGQNHRNHDENTGGRTSLFLIAVACIVDDDVPTVCVITLPVSRRGLPRHGWSSHCWRASRRRIQIVHSCTSVKVDRQSWPSHHVSLVYASRTAFCDRDRLRERCRWSHWSLALIGVNCVSESPVGRSCRLPMDKKLADAFGIWTANSPAVSELTRRRLETQLVHKSDLATVYGEIKYTI